MLSISCICFTCTIFPISFKSFLAHTFAFFTGCIIRTFRTWIFSINLWKNKIHWYKFQIKWFVLLHKNFSIAISTHSSDTSLRNKLSTWLSFPFVLWFQKHSFNRMKTSHYPGNISLGKERLKWTLNFSLSKLNVFTCVIWRPALRNDQDPHGALGCISECEYYISS